MPDGQFEFLKNELNSLRIDVKSLGDKLLSIHQHLTVCQARCHVPGPDRSIMSAGKDIVNRLIDRLL